MEEQPQLFIAPKSREENSKEQSQALGRAEERLIQPHRTFITPSPASHGCFSLQDSGLFPSHPTNLSKSLAALLEEEKEEEEVEVLLLS